jgi:hypothetical protein
MRRVRFPWLLFLATSLGCTEIYLPDDWQRRGCVASRGVNCRGNPSCAALHFICAGFNYSLFEGRYCNFCLVSCTSNAATCGLSQVPPVPLPCISRRKQTGFMDLCIHHNRCYGHGQNPCNGMVRGHLCACTASNPNCELLKQVKYLVLYPAHVRICHCAAVVLASSHWQTKRLPCFNATGTNAANHAMEQALGT